MHHLTGQAARAVCDAIAQQLATLVSDASYQTGTCVVEYYCLDGHVFRCEVDEVMYGEEPYVEELVGPELADFRYCRDC